MDIMSNLVSTSRIVKLNKRLTTNSLIILKARSYGDIFTLFLSRARCLEQTQSFLICNSLFYEDLKKGMIF